MTTKTSAPAVKDTEFQSKLNTKAPNEVAKIISRSSPSRGLVTYTLLVGITEIPSVSPAEVVEYVSEYDLEVFENQQFEKDIKEEEAKQKERLAARAQAQALRQNRYVSSSDGDESVSDVSLSGENTRMATGGRQRPTYTHFYPKQRAPRGSSKPSALAGSESDVKQYWIKFANTSMVDHRDSKRRRLRDDRNGSMSSAQDTKSIYSVTSRDPPPPTQPPSAMEQAAGLLSDAQESDPMDVDDESDKNDIGMPIRQPTAPIRDKGKDKAAASAFFTFRDHAVAPTQNPVSAKARLVAELSGRQASTASAKAAATAKGTMPMVSASNSTRQTVVNLNDSQSESEDDSDGSEVYTVEKILAHNKSDPRSHNKSIHGEKSVMLYQVKWEGYDDTTWEPATSFQDTDVLQEYWAQVAQKQKQKPLASSSKDTVTLKGQAKDL